MSAQDDIYSALRAGLVTAESLLSWQRTNEGHRLVQSRIHTIQLGISAWGKISQRLRDGKMHIAVENPEYPTTCTCNAVPMPPCAFCESQRDEK
jgi:hypothetical protein